CQEAALVAFVTEFDDGAIAPVEAPTQTVGGAIPVGSGPWGVAVHPAGTEVWATNRTGSSVGVIDAVTRRVTATVTVGDTPLGVAVRPDGQRAYVANFGGGTVTVIDTATHAAVGTIRVGDGPSGLAFNPAGTRLYVSNYRSDTVSVVDTAAGTVVATVPVGARPLGLAVDAVRSRLYVANYGSDDVSVVGTFSNTVLTTVAVGAKPFGVAADGAHGRVYVTNAASDTVSIIDTGVNAVVGTVSVGRAPFGVDVDPTGQRVWVANAGGNTLSVLDTAAPAVAATVPVGRLPIALGRFLAVVGDCPAASLGGCDDADPFTIDTCVPQSGCEHATHGAGDGLFAGLGALADALDASIEPDLGGSKAANLLKQLIDQARGFLGTPLARAADVLTPLDHPGVKTSRATRKRLRRVDRALERFIRLVAKGLRRNTLQRDVGWRLLDLARAADQSVHAALGRKTPVPSARRAGSPVPHPNAVAPTRLPPPFGRTPSGDLAL